MKDSLLRVIDDLETKQAAAEEGEKSTEKSRLTKDVMENMLYAGVAQGLKYAIQEIRKVVDDL